MAARKTITAMRVARKLLSQSRTAIVEGHSKPAGSRRRSSITDVDVLVSLLEHDDAIARLDAAIAHENPPQEPF